MDGGSLSYVRDGKTYEGGLLGGDIEEAVSGNARAEEYAHDYKTGMATGFALSMFGIASMAGGVAITAIGASRPSSSQALPVAGLLAVVAGAALDLIGAGVMSSAVPHLYDAVNAYNDEVAIEGRPQALR